MDATTGHPRSWRVRALGTPAEALRLEPRPIRTPGPGEVRVRVDAVGLNFPDLLLCAGRYQERPELPFSPGYEAAGVVVEVGEGSARTPGEHVLVVPELPEGALQESLTLPDAEVYPVPPDMPPAHAATLHIAYATAHAALHHRAGLRAGEWVLVTGAAGGVGLAAIQLARAAGAHVVAVARGEAKRAVCTQNGAEAVLDPATPDLVAHVREITGGGADVVVDVVGGALFAAVRRCVRFEGRLVTVGFTSGEIPQAPVNHVLMRNYALIGLHLALYRREDPQLLRRIHDDLLDLYARGAIVPLVRELPFEDAVEALDLLTRRDVVGRIALRCGRGAPA